VTLGKSQRETGRRRMTELSLKMRQCYFDHRENALNQRENALNHLKNSLNLREKWLKLLGTMDGKYLLMSHKP
jgi:hypothetical protein